ncbi:hypothetical protein GE09DRAFT_1295616 [Coniochaeta sp. 2T2.1]|nr:hypothetical protein GE09DRAFT_1295616 [Coniochaeta sp. 2T2.1]
MNGHGVGGWDDELDPKVLLKEIVDLLTVKGETATNESALAIFDLSALDYDSTVPLTKIRVFTEHQSEIRRKGVASTIKNVAFDVPSHPAFLSEDEINILPYILLPITGSEQYDEDDMMGMLPDLQLLPPDKQRDSDPKIVAGAC